MKKLVVAVISVLIFCNLIFINTCSQASVLNDKSAYKEFILSSTTTVNTSSPFKASFIGSPLSIANIIDKISRLINVGGLTVKWITKSILQSTITVSENMGKAVGATAETVEKLDNIKEELKELTVEKLILGVYKTLDINFINGEKGTPNYWLKSSVQRYYMVCTYLALTLSLFSLIYIGIRMLISTIAEEKAKYKTMLVNWAIGIAVLFLFKYIIIVLIAISDALLGIIYRIFYTSGFSGVETTVLETLQNSMAENGGWKGLLDSVFFLIIIIYQMCFFWKYFMRMLKFAFLVIISPIITVTYAIDKVGDGKSQAFNAWFKEVVKLVFMPVIHSSVYILFIVSTSEMIKQAPFLAIVMFLCMVKGEDIVIKTLKLTSDDESRMVKMPFMKKRK